VSRTIQRLLEGPVEDIAPGLLGWRLRTEFAGGPTEVVITEVEAYAGERDPASHAYRGMTARNGSMFGEQATLYVYRSYGLHWCMNIVTGGPNDPSAVLVRAGRPLIGADVMARRRGRSDHLADGPGKLTQALGVSGDLDGTSVLTGPVSLLEGANAGGRIIATPRVGISKAVAWPWRFVLLDG
jgi:DNA-3-methyladenine glycosylase